MKILIFIITYKASFRVKKIMEEIPFKFLKKYKYKILIADDCSNDDTKKYISNIKKHYKNILTKYNNKNLGYGGNIKQCLNFAYRYNYNYAVMIHGDNQYSSSYIKDLIRVVKKNNSTAVTGSRMKNKIIALNGGMPIYKFLGNIFLTKIFNIIYQTKFTDCHTGYWLYNLKEIRKDWLNNLNNGYLFDLEMRLKLVNKKKSILEIPIKTRYGTERSLFHVKYAVLFLLKSLFNKIKKI